MVSPFFTVRPSEANESMHPPATLTRNEVTIDTDLPHVIFPGRGGAEVCFVHLQGTGSSPTESFTCLHYLSTAAEQYGMKTICLSYHWLPLADQERNAKMKPMGQSGLVDLHVDALYGHKDALISGSCSGILSVPPCNSIVARLEALVGHLAKSRPESENWGNLLIAGSKTVDFSKLIISGHSQGSGHAAYLAKKQNCFGAVLLSGPQEFVSEDSTSWLDGPWSTTNIVAFMHDAEEGTAELIRENWAHIEPLRIREVGVHAVSWESCRANHYVGERRAFTTSIPPRTYIPNARPCHNSTSGDQWTPLWAVDDDKREHYDCERSPPERVYRTSVWPALIALLLQSGLPLYN